MVFLHGIHAPLFLDLSPCQRHLQYNVPFRQNQTDRDHRFWNLKAFLSRAVSLSRHAVEIDPPQAGPFHGFPVFSPVHFFQPVFRRRDVCCFPVIQKYCRKDRSKDKPCGQDKDKSVSCCCLPKRGFECPFELFSQKGKKNNLEREARSSTFRFP